MATGIENYQLVQEIKKKKRKGYLTGSNSFKPVLGLR